MVKRKSPIVLITILIVGVISVTFFNAKSHPPDPDAPPTPANSDAGTLHGSQPNPSPSQLLTNGGPGGGKSGMPHPGPGGPGGPPGAGDGVIQHSMGPATKPKPTDNMTASGWYNKDAPSSAPVSTH